MNYSQVLQTPKAEPSYGDRPFQPIARQGGFHGTKARVPQTTANQPKQKQRVTRKRSPRNRGQKGRGGQKLETGSTSHDQPQKVQYPPTPRPVAPETTRATVSINTKEGASAIKSSDQLSRKSDMELSVATSKLPIGQQAPIHVNKDEPSAANHGGAVHIVNNEPVVFDNTGKRWNLWMIQFAIDAGVNLPPEVMAVVESGALPLRKDDENIDEDDDEVDDSSSVHSDDDSEDAASLKPVESPSQKSKTGNSSPTKASSPNVRKRIADEEQSGTGTLTKRPKID